MTETDRAEILRRAEVASLAASRLFEAVWAAGLSAALIAAAHSLDDAAGDLGDELAEALAEGIARQEPVGYMPPSFGADPDCAGPELLPPVVPVFIRDRLDAAVRMGLLPERPTRAQVLAAIGHGRYLDAAMYYVRAVDLTGV